MELLDDLRIRFRRWLGLSQFQRSTRDRLDSLEAKVAVSQEDLERLNAATSRIAARVSSLLDLVDELGTGNDDEVRAQAQRDAVLQSSAELRPVIEQLEALGADASNPVPEPAPEQVPVEPGPDVPPVENAGETPVEEAPPVEGDGTVVTDPEPPPGHVDNEPVFDESGIAVTDPAPSADAPAEGDNTSVPGESGEEAHPTNP